MTNKNILITGGGTGGHLYPALAVIEFFRTRYPDASISFIGSEKGSGRRLIMEMGIDFHTVKARGLAGGGNIIKKALNYLVFLLYIIPGFLKALSIMRRKKIHIVLGMGGYICAPVLLAAIIRKTGFSLQEQKYIPGRLNRLFSSRARFFFTSFKDTGKYLKRKNNIVFSGNPVRKSIRLVGKLKPDYGKWGLSKGKFTITAFGGSLGARKINEIILELGNMDDLKDDVQILLISGTRFYKSTSDGFPKTGIKNTAIRIFPYIDEIEKVYRITDLIIARAGANTVFETATVGIPSILIPYPYAIDNHQLYNARYLEKRGISILIEEKKLETSFLAQKIKDLLKDGRKIYNKMKEIRPGFTSIDSAAVICEKLMEDVFEYKE